MAESSMVSQVSWPSHALPVAACLDNDDLDSMDFGLDLDVDFHHADEKSGVTQCEAQESNAPPWDCLPPEILTKIFFHLGDKDKESAECTCVAWGEACNNPTLWHTQDFSFTGDNCLEMVNQGCRTIERKGYLLRTLTLRIGVPSVPQAWMMSQCVQGLLEFIAQQPGTRHIHSVTISNLNFFRHWRFFTLSKHNILLAVNNFLLSQSRLRHVDLAMCRLSADDGMRILRALVIGQSRHTVRRLHLHGFFQPKYQATLGGRFRRLVSTSFTGLRHLSLDARHLDPDFLVALLSRSPSQASLSHMTVHLESSAPREPVAESVWERVRRLSPDFTVSFVFEGRLPSQVARLILTPSVPLTEVVVIWPKGSRQSQAIHLQLTDLLNRVTALYSGLLEKVRLKSRIRAKAETELALIRLATQCRRLAEFRVSVKLSESVIQQIRSTLLARGQNILIEVNPLKKKPRAISPKTRSRSCGSH
ncbi:hypothetical protein EGW08_006697 [Elysia chlorotica]|uniref:F-box domain-containing protein n=1 Tax=Elysia chlorotica TaxID=188477 RepID=A0A433TVG3_ELYCH|nr:hypothetical protein EGW08_006697 [Elysia chlorotica]